MTGPRVIVVQLERWGYHCTCCNALHRPGDAPYDAHTEHGPEGLVGWTETHCWLVHRDGGVTRLPAAIGLGALVAAELEK